MGNWQYCSRMSATSIPCLPDIEEWLKEWQAKGGVELTCGPISPLLEMCRCCGKLDCEHHKVMADTLKTLDHEARLAAVVGQQLLKKYETLSTENEQIQRTLDETLQRMQEANFEKSDELGKRNWECQKTEKLLQETAADLETANANREELEMALHAAREEIDTLRAAKMVADTSNSREGELQTMLNDANHELGYLRKKEQTLESNHNELKKRYAQLSTDYDGLKQRLDTTMAHQDGKAAQETLHAFTRKERKTNHVPSLNVDGEAQNSSQLLVLIKELAAANNKLKTELVQCKEQLSEAQGGLEALEHNDHAKSGFEQSDELQTSTPRTLAIRPSRTRSSSSHSSKSKRRMVRSKGRRVMEGKEDTGRARTRPTPTSSTSTPSVVHHHYHYYIESGEKSIHETNEEDLASCPENDVAKLDTRSLVLSPSSSTAILDSSDKDSSPYCLLHMYGERTLERLKATDNRTLNRPLRRSFNIEELSSMSNSVIGNILEDIETLRTRFAWVDSDCPSGAPWLQDVAMSIFTAFVRLLQDLLKEVGELRMTVNDLQVEYVKKVQEDGMRVEREILRRRETQKQEEPLLSPSSSSMGWLSTVLSLSSFSSPSSPASSPKTTRVPGRGADRPGPPSSIPSPKPSRFQLPRASKSTGTLTKRRHEEFEVSDDLLSSWKAQSLSLGWPSGK